MCSRPTLGCPLQGSPAPSGAKSDTLTKQQSVRPRPSERGNAQSPDPLSLFQWKEHLIMNALWEASSVGADACPDCPSLSFSCCCRPGQSPRPELPSGDNKAHLTRSSLRELAVWRRGRGGCHQSCPLSSPLRYGSACPVLSWKESHAQHH